MRIRWAFSVSFALFATATAHGKDFCDSGALTSTERVICSSPSLVWEDRLLNALHNLGRQLVPAKRPQLAAEQRQWLNEVRNACTDAQCLIDTYRSRNQVLRDFVNTAADPMPDGSEWSVSYASGRRRGTCEDSFDLGFLRTTSGQVVGIWEANSCSGHADGGVIDVQEDGRIYDVRLLGGRDSGNKAGVALLARKGSQLYVANMFEPLPLSEGAVIWGTRSYKQEMSNDYYKATVEDLESAWSELEKVNGCALSQGRGVYCRRARPISPTTGHN